MEGGRKNEGSRKEGKKKGREEGKKEECRMKKEEMMERREEERRNEGKKEGKKEGRRDLVNGSIVWIRPKFFNVKIKTMLPYSRFKYSSLGTSHRLKIHVMGSMVFGKSLVCFLDAMEFPHDSNLNVNVILQVIIGFLYSCT